MARTLYSATMSLDGYIAGPAGDMSWLTEHLSPTPELDGLVGRIGALLVGATTWTGDDPNAGTDREGAFGGQWHGPQFVLTHHPPADMTPDVTYTADVAGAVAAAKEAAGDQDYVNILGADVARQCLELGLLDEVLVIVAPVLLGDGTPLFRRTDGERVLLTRTRASIAEGVVVMWFDVPSA